ncbi:ATP-dependent RNA helicase DBP8 [Sugiyamaella lignohabitans]|uniref:ATP-dependent RNA helicase DBP8 n=1 Tax=Sugiyamaella lignohabitans TaxID=796027 RepID=A0A167D409_9ASCO|nr:ATP-dependent RNA helicase DBP8 [Sugiyamaella lignohabitans]ANB12449.1 ATP-dependent RNA helicase DBP8 [Sugiyamaella lignohabitans]
MVHETRYFAGGEMSFESLGVSKWLVEALNVMAIHSPSAIQSACIPAILDGRDCIGGAKTGSGKTIAFAAPMLTKWSLDPFGICGLILTPTRELAIQIAEQFAALGANMNVRTAVIVGGVDMVNQTLELQRRPHFVIATPGRLADHIKSSGPEAMNGLKRVQYLVLDEADRLLSSSFAEDLEECINILPPPEKRQTLLFTATITDAVRSLQDAPVKPGKKRPFMHEVVTDDAVAIPASLSQSFLLVPSYVKEAYLFSILTHEDNKNKSAIVFVNRTKTAELLRRVLQSLEVRATSLHSQMPQSERINALGRFRAEAARVLVATDVAGRGLDIPVVEMVINFDIPADADDYVHRVGRTARAGRAGESISLVTERDVSRIENIEKRVGSKMDKYEKVTDTQVIETSLKKISTAKREAGMDMDKENFGERKRIQKEKKASFVSKRSQRKHM